MTSKVHFICGFCAVCTILLPTRATAKDICTDTQQVISVLLPLMRSTEELLLDDLEVEAVLTVEFLCMLELRVALLLLEGNVKCYVFK